MIEYGTQADLDAANSNPLLIPMKKYFISKKTKAAVSRCENSLDSVESVYMRDFSGDGQWYRAEDLEAEPVIAYMDQQETINELSRLLGLAIQTCTGMGIKEQARAVLAKIDANGRQG